MNTLHVAVNPSASKSTAAYRTSDIFLRTMLPPFSRLLPFRAPTDNTPCLPVDWLHTEHADFSERFHGMDLRDAA